MAVQVGAQYLEARWAAVEFCWAESGRRTRERRVLGAESSATTPAKWPWPGRARHHHRKNLNRLRHLDDIYSVKS